MAAPDRVYQLVETFEKNRLLLKQSQYGETEVRVQFIDPLFETLGWDVRNASGRAPTDMEVIHEDAVKVGQAHKAPDYGFYAGRERKFFVEAKKPAVNLRVDSSPAFQLRRYAWSARLLTSVLTDFEEFAIYDGTVQPDMADPASRARLTHLTYEQYVDRWDEIASLFSKEAVYDGAIEERFEREAVKRGKATVDRAFLAEIERWRELLARNIALRNPGLSARELNYAVQMTVDRIIFLRMAEDRDIEPYERLLEISKGAGVYDRLQNLYRLADQRYNSGLFHFQKERGRGHPDDLTPTLAIDDRVLRDIFRNLYYPESPYEFSVLPVDVLGQVYEQFLGKVISVNTRGRVEIEEKPEVRKAGGVYYTPAYIVDYIVEHTVGKLLEGRTPRAVRSRGLRIVDPACGSGSFLLGAYEYLLRWYRDWYVQDGPEKHQNQLYRVALKADGEHVAADWRLTTDERKRILLDHIHGVDIDPQAVEVTKLSLLLKLLEGESQATLNPQLRLLQERVLPDLEANIKSGNSLIGPDFYASQQMALLPAEEQYRINVFDWYAAFPDAFKGDNPGFDAVIGNPPYIFGEYHVAVTKSYMRDAFEVARGQFDMYWLFIERSLSLTRGSGYFSMIVPDALLARDETVGLRRTLLSAGLERVYHCGQVFAASVSACVLVVHKNHESDTITSQIREGTVAVTEHTCARRRFEVDAMHRLLVHASDREAELLWRLDGLGTTVGIAFVISRGEEVGKKFVSESGRHPIVVGDDISRFALKIPTRYVETFNKPQSLYAAPKIIIVKTGMRCIATIDTVGYVTMQSVYNLQARQLGGDDAVPDRLMILLATTGILNSRLIDYYIRKTFTAYKLLFPQLNQSTIEGIPMPVVADLVSRSAGLVTLVERMLALHEQVKQARTSFERTALQRQIAATDQQIDRLVYELYELTDDEIRIVEDATAR